MAFVTDRSALLRNRRRAVAGTPVTFLHEAARREVEDRLSMVNKTFQDVAIVTGFPDLWAGLHPRAQTVTDDETLPLQEATLDLVVHALCLHWANDPVGQLVQARRALRPDGLFLGVLAGGETLQELRIALAQAETDLYGGLSPRIAPMGEIRGLGGLLQRAGFALPVADSVPLRASYPSALHLMRELRHMGEGNALMARRRTPSRRALFTRTAEIYAREFADRDGRVRASFDLIVLTGWAPDASQPQPLRPGSATARLADAIRARETPIED